MHFSSEDFFNYMRQEIVNPASSEEMYIKLVEILKADVSWKLYMRIERVEDREDVFQDICLSVFKNLTKFLLNPDSAECEANRFRWLFTIVDRKIADYYRKNYIEISYNPTEEEIINKLEFARQKALDEGKSQEEIDIMLEEERQKCYKKLQNKVPLEVDPDNGYVIVDNANTPEKQVILDDIDDRLAEHIGKILCIKTAPEKRLSYIYSKFIIPTEWGGHISGKPKATEERLCGHTLFEILRMFKRDLPLALNKNIPDNIYSVIERDLNMLDEIAGDNKLIGERSFKLTSSRITSATNRIDDKLAPSRLEVKASRHKENISNQTNQYDFVTNKFK